MYVDFTNLAVGTQLAADQFTGLAFRKYQDRVGGIVVDTPSGQVASFNDCPGCEFFSSGANVGFSPPQHAVTLQVGLLPIKGIVVQRDVRLTAFGADGGPLASASASITAGAGFGTALTVDVAAPRIASVVLEATNDPELLALIAIHRITSEEAPPISSKQTHLWELRLGEVLGGAGPTTSPVAAYVGIDDGFGSRNQELVAFGNGPLAQLVFGSTGRDLPPAGSGWPSAWAAGSFDVVPDKTLHTPVLAQLRDSSWYVFATSVEGHLYKLDVPRMRMALTGGVSQWAYLGRGSSCLVPDSLMASPVVQLAADADGTDPLDVDIVMVPTCHGCGSTTTNTVLAFNAADIAQGPLWVFNQDGDYSIDCARACLLDSARNALIVVTDLKKGRSQNTVWSFNTANGTLNWAVNLGSVHSRPALGDPAAGGFDHLYVLDMRCHLHALDPASGAELWEVALNGTPGAYSAARLSVGEGTHGKTIVATTSAGNVCAIQDGGRNAGGGVLAWDINRLGGVKATSGATIVSPLGKVYVGFDDGTVCQFDLATGTEEGLACFAGTMPSTTLAYTTPDPLVYRDGSDHKLVASTNGSGGTMREFIVPLQFAVEY